MYDLVEKMNTLTKYETLKSKLMEEIQESKKHEQNKDVYKTIENKIQRKKSSCFSSRISLLSQNLKTSVDNLSPNKQEKALVEMVFYMVRFVNNL